MAVLKSPVWALLLLLACLPGACKQSLPPQMPETVTAGAVAAPWLSQLIQQLQEAAPANPPAKVYRYTFNNPEVYYLTRPAPTRQAQYTQVWQPALCAG